MKNVWTFILLLMITVAIFFSVIQAHQGFTVVGRWITEDGQVDVTREGQTVKAKFITGGDCPFGPKRTMYFEGELSEASCGGILVSTCEAQLTGTLYRCTTSEELIKDCHLDAEYTVPFQATAGWKTINGTFKNEHYSKKENDKNKNQSANENDNPGCKWTRDSTGDKPIRFSMTRWQAANPSGDRNGKRCTKRPSRAC